MVLVEWSDGLIVPGQLVFLFSDDLTTRPSGQGLPDHPTKDHQTQNPAPLSRNLL